MATKEILWMVFGQSAMETPQAVGGKLSIVLVAQARLDPLSRDRCSNTPVAMLCFSGCRKPSLLYPLLAQQTGPIAAKRLCKGGGIVFDLGVFDINHKLAWPEQQ